MKKTDMNPFEIWLMAIRPATLFAAFVPVLMGGCIAYAYSRFNLKIFIFTLVSALCIQIATNFINDIEDFKKGSDKPGRKGPLRVVAEGLVSVKSMKRAVVVVFSLALLTALPLVYRGGAVIVIIGVISILSGIWYTAGRYSLAYLGFSDIFVLVFFGPVALAGTFYLQTLAFDLSVFALGFAPGLISVAILAVNNLRDADDDVKTGKKTTAVRFGKRFARAEILACIIIPHIIILVLSLVKPGFALSWISLASLPSGLKIVRDSSRLSGKDLNKVLKNTGKYLFMTGVLFSLGILINKSGVL